MNNKISIAGHVTSNLPLDLHSEGMSIMLHTWNLMHLRQSYLAIILYCNEHVKYIPNIAKEYFMTTLIRPPHCYIRRHSQNFPRDFQICVYSESQRSGGAAYSTNTF